MAAQKTEISFEDAYEHLRDEEWEVSNVAKLTLGIDPEYTEYSIRDEEWPKVFAREVVIFEAIHARQIHDATDDHTRSIWKGNGTFIQVSQTLSWLYTKDYTVSKTLLTPGKHDKRNLRS